MTLFNPLASSKFNTSFFVPDEADYKFRVGAPKLNTRNKKDGGKFFEIVIPLRIMGGNATHNNKLVNYGCYLGNVDPNTGQFETEVDDEGNETPKCDFSAVARVYHAAMGYGTTKAEDDRFNEEQGDQDYTIDLVEGKLVGSAWAELKDTEIRATITHRPDPIKPGVNYPQFSAIRPL